MARIDAYLRSVENYQALGTVLASGQSVMLRFPTGDRHATQVTTHDQLVALVREIAPPQCLDQVDSGKATRFEYEAGGRRYQVAVSPRAGAWTVAIEAAPDVVTPPPKHTDFVAPPVGEMTIERTQYEPRSGAGPSTFADVLHAARQAGASDVHFHAGGHPAVRIAGSLVVLADWPRVDADALDRELVAIAPAEARQRWEAQGYAVFAYDGAAGRLRVRAGRDHQGPFATARLLPEGPVTAAQMGIPEAILTLFAGRSGLYLLTGPRGSGLSTTRSAILSRLDQERVGLVVTLEQPIEIVMTGKTGIVSQREVGIHAPSGAEGVRAAVREGADLVAVDGDNSDVVLAIIDALLSGVRVLVTLNGASVPAGIEQLIEMAPEQRRGMVRAVVANTLSGGVAQVLCKRAQGGLIPAFEVLAGGGVAAAAIRDQRTFQLSSVMSTGRSQGMISLNDSLVELTSRRVIAPDEALRKSPSPLELRALLDATSA